MLSSLGRCSGFSRAQAGRRVVGGAAGAEQVLFRGKNVFEYFKVKEKTSAQHTADTGSAVHMDPEVYEGGRD